MEFLVAAALACLSICIIKLKINADNKEATISLLKLDKQLERNRAVYWFRRFMLKNYPDLYDKLPSYKEMIESDKIMEEYFYEV